MTYKNNQTGQIGTLYQLLPNVSNPILFTEEELLELNIEKYIEPIIEPVLKPLEEYKVDKYKQLCIEGTEFILNTYSLPQQTSANTTLIDPDTAVYTVEEANTIRDFCVKYHAIIKSTGVSINEVSTHEEVDLVYFRKVEENPETLEVISETFWGA